MRDSRSGVLDTAYMAKYGFTDEKRTALRTAYLFSQTASDVGYDWDTIQEVENKLSEEVEELLYAQTVEEKLDELGDVMFVLVNYYRWLGGEAPENLLSWTNLKFYKRFAVMENYMEEDDKKFSSCTKEDFGYYWGKAKEVVTMDSLKEEGQSNE